MPFEFIISNAGILLLVTQGPIAFLLMRFAEKICNDPEYEKKVFKRSYFKDK